MSILQKTSYSQNSQNSQKGGMRAPMPKVFLRIVRIMRMGIFPYSIGRSLSHAAWSDAGKRQCQPTHCGHTDVCPLLGLVRACRPSNPAQIQSRGAA